MNEKHTLTLEVFCSTCRKRFLLKVNESDYYRWKRGEFIQNAMPYLTAAERELLISRTCGDCWNELFPPEEE